MEQEQIEQSGPTEEQVMQALQEGGQEAPAQQDATETERPAQTDTAPVEEKYSSEQVRKMIAEALNPIQSEVGQFRKVRSEWDKQRAASKTEQVPQTIAQMTPEQMQASRDLVKHLFEEMYGEQFNALTARNEEMERQSQRMSIVDTAREYAGAQYAELDPVIGNLFTELKAKADAGDQRAARFVDEIYSTESGVLRLVDLAKQEHAKTIEARKASTATQQAQSRKNAATAIGNTNQAPVSSDAELSRIQKIRDPAERAEAARKYWQDKGVLE